MLVLSRKLGEKIVIGEAGEIVIEVCRVRGNQVGLAIKCPRHVPVWRAEIGADALARTDQRRAS